MSTDEITVISSEFTNVILPQESDLDDSLLVQQEEIHSNIIKDSIEDTQFICTKLFTGIVVSFILFIISLHIIGMTGILRTPKK